MVVSYLIEMQAIKIHKLCKEAWEALEVLYRTTKVPRMRTRAQMILLSAEQGLSAPQIAEIVRESARTVQRWLNRYQAEGIQGLYDAPRSGSPGKVTPLYKDLLLASVRRRPRVLGLPYSLWTLDRLADYMAEQTGVRICPEAVRKHLKAKGIVVSRPQHKISSPDPDYEVKKKEVEEKREHLEEDAVFYYADEFNISWQPTLKAMWSPLAQQVMIPTPGQTKKHYGIGAVNYHSGETVVMVQKHKKRDQIAQLLEKLLEKHPQQKVYVAWDNADTHSGGKVEEVLRGAAGDLNLLYLPTYSPWLNPIEMLWRHFRREVTHCELFVSVQDLLKASLDFFERYNNRPGKALSIIGAHPT